MRWQTPGHPAVIQRQGADRSATRATESAVVQRLNASHSVGCKRLSESCAVPNYLANERFEQAQDFVRIDVTKEADLGPVRKRNLE